MLPNDTIISELFFKKNNQKLILKGQNLQLGAKMIILEKDYKSFFSKETLTCK